MKRYFGGATAAVSLISTLPAFGAGLERDNPSTRVFFEEGRYVELSFTSVNPDLEGTGGFAPGPIALNGSTGDLFERYASIGAAYKADINDRLSYAFILDQPLGASTSYPGGGALPAASALYAGTDFDLSTYELTGALIYEALPGVSVYAGLRAQQFQADAAVPWNGAYSIETDRSDGFGYMIGAAYERPEIALRVALTYHSAIEHDIAAVENSALTGGADTNSTFMIEVPEALTLEFQTGVAENTLVFGSVRHADWSNFDITPNFFPSGALLQYTGDWTTYTLGVGQRLNENLSVFARGGFESSNDTVLTSLGPVDGRWSIGVGGTYTTGNVEITGGITYEELGETQNLLGTTFQDGSAIGIGFRIGMNL